MSRFADNTWTFAKVLPAGVHPIDEGPGLAPIVRHDFANIPVDLGSQLSPAVSSVANVGNIRAALLTADPLQAALNRPNREIVVPVRATTANMMQALELTNGATLDVRLQHAAAKFMSEVESDPSGWIVSLYRHVLSRDPSSVESHIASELLGSKPGVESIADLLWTLVNLPEFQLIN